MKNIYFTVGPSQIYPTIPKHLTAAVKENILSLNHRGEEFKQIFKEITIGLKQLLDIPKDYQIFFVSSALEGMERTIQGCVEKTSFHVISGAFGEFWADYAKKLGKEVLRYEMKVNENFDLLDIDIPKRAELICITQNDTSTGFWISPESITKLKQKYPEKLIALDIVSSLPYVNVNYKEIDVAFFSVQKGLGLPAGLGIVIINPKALEKTELLFKKGINIGSYHSFKNLSEKAKTFQTPETPNVLGIYLLNKVIQDMLKKGIAKIRRETETKAKILYNFFEKHKKYQPHIKNIQFRSPTTLVIDVKNESEKVRKIAAKAGFLIGAGYGENQLTHIRIANFPSQKLKNLKILLSLLN